MKGVFGESADLGFLIIFFKGDVTVFISLFFLSGEFSASLMGMNQIFFFAYGGDGRLEKMRFRAF